MFKEVSSCQRTGKSLRLKFRLSETQGAKSFVCGLAGLEPTTTRKKYFLCVWSFSKYPNFCTLKNKSMKKAEANLLKDSPPLCAWCVTVSYFVSSVDSSKTFVTCSVTCSRLKPFSFAFFVTSKTVVKIRL